MPAPSKYTPTLAGVQNSLKTDTNLSPGQRAELVSAVSRLCEINGLSPADVIADPVVLRGLIARTPWLLAGLKKPSWNNIRSRLKRALSIAGIAIDRQRRNFKPNDEWEVLLAPLDRRDRDELHRFAGWCTVRGFSPKVVTAILHADFMAYLEAQSLQRNPRERAHVVRRAWNRAIAVPGSPYTQLPGPEPVGRPIMRWSDFPESLRAEYEVYAARIVEPDPLDEDHRSIKPITLQNYSKNLRIILTTMVEHGAAPVMFTTLADVVDPSVVKRAMTLCLGDSELDERARKYLQGLAIAALNVAAYLDLDPAKGAQLKVLLKKVQFKAKGMCKKNKERLIVVRDPALRATLINLPPRVAKDLANVTHPTVRQAQRMQMAVLAELLLHVPMRIRNAAELDLGDMIVPPVGGKIGRWRIAIPEQEVKNQTAIDAELDDGLSALLDRYVKTFRPVLATAGSARLFTGQSGTSKGPSALAKQLAKFVWRETGIVIHAHLMRHIAAHLYLMANPGDYETVRRLLGHKDIATTIRFYAEQTAQVSFELYDAVIAKARLEASQVEGKATGNLKLEDVL